MTQMGETADTTIAKAMAHKRKNFDAWLVNELKEAVARSRSPDYITRKEANPRVELLDAAAKVWAEFLTQLPLPFKD